MPELTFSRKLTVLAGLLVAGAANAQSWHVRPISEPNPRDMNPVMKWVKDFETAEVRYEELQAALANAPKQILGLGEHHGVELLLPTPTGIQRFKVWENDLLSAEVQATVPDQRTFSGQGIDDPNAVVRFEMGYGRFRAMIMGTDGFSFIEPMKRTNDGTYFFYHRRESLRQPSWFCKTIDRGTTIPFLDQPVGGTYDPTSRNTGTNLRTFRLALNGNAEYVAFHGTTTSAVSAMTTSINRVDGVYTREMAIKLNLVRAKPHTNAATFTNNNGGTMLGQNQTQCDSDPGSANYDVGHVFSTGGGGVAGLGVLGVSGQKARGVTGSGSPVGDGFDIDYVAHELGHQFGGEHSFNGVESSCGGGNRNRTTAWEPGSGSTIMAYAGICGTENVQSNSDAYFHMGNINQILPYRDSATRGGVSSATTNIVPTVNAGADYTIPPSTPFKLTMTASDGNSDPMTFQWDELDVPATGTANQGSTTVTTTNTSRPLFRSFNPNTNPTRFFPSQSLILANNFTHQHEFLPNVARTMNFRAVARDNRATGGGTAWDTAVITVSGTSSFAVSSPNTAVTWNRNNLFTVTWNNALTNLAPFNVAQVRILLSVNGGASYFTNPSTVTVLSAATANDGTETLALPLGTPGGSSNRIIVEAVGNAFFDISNTNFTISTTNAVPTLAVVGTQNIPELALWNYNLVGADTDTAQTIAYSIVSGPSGLTVNPTTGLLSWTPSEAQGPGSYPVTVRVSDNNFPTPGTADRSFTINVTEVGTNVTGTVNFNSYIPTEVGKQVLVQIGPNANSTISESGTVTLGAGNAFAFSSNLPNGTYRVYVTRNYYLRRRISNVVISGGTVNAGTFNLICGDADNSGEIDATDIDIVIANFGSATDPGDIDGSGEVDASDIDLTIANFGATGD